MGGRVVVENFEPLELDDDQAATLIGMGLLARPDAGDGDYAADELMTTALVWDELGLSSDATLDLFQAVLGGLPLGVPELLAGLEVGSLDDLRRLVELGKATGL